mgnify:CR=1 FL=1
MVQRTNHAYESHLHDYYVTVVVLVVLEREAGLIDSSWRSSRREYSRTRHAPMSCAPTQPPQPPIITSSTSSIVYRPSCVFTSTYHTVRTRSRPPTSSCPQTRNTNTNTNTNSTAESEFDSARAHRTQTVPDMTLIEVSNSCHHSLS